ncbi:MAG: ROK family transcriptional regulator [Treponema sp.]|jgi:predicted NBD/HSP70 family sugar kinase|nr:ROK family transcriptional regulator [Treponema sp.]
MVQDPLSTDKKQTNRNRIYQLVYQEGTVSKPEIASRLGISLPTAIMNVKNLQDEGFLKEGEVTDASAGRKAGRKAVSILYEKNARFAIGTDITRSHVSVVLINLAAEIIEGARVEMPFENSQYYYQEVVDIIRRLVKVAGVDPGIILGAGFSVPGVLSRDGQMIIYSHVLQVSGLLCSAFSRGLGYPAVLCNDANAAGFAELWKHKYRTDAVYLSLSDSVGGAILLNNDLYLGENQRAGEFGHMTLIRDGLPCYCGRNGCMDSYCSAQVLSRHTGGSLELFFRKLKDGDKDITVVWGQYLSYLAMALNNLLVSFDCTLILGGFLGEYLEPYIKDIQDSVSKLTTFSGIEDYITACSYKKEAAAVGVALLYVRPFIRQI